MTDRVGRSGLGGVSSRFQVLEDEGAPTGTQTPKRIPLGPFTFRQVTVATCTGAYMLGQACLLCPMAAAGEVGRDHRVGVPLSELSTLSFHPQPQVLQGEWIQTQTGPTDWTLTRSDPKAPLQARGADVLAKATQLDAEAHAQLVARGLRATPPKGSTTGMLGVLLFVDAWEASTGLKLAALSTKQQAHLIKNLRTLDRSVLQQNIARLARLPRSLADDFASWNQINGRTISVAAMQRTEAVAQLGFEPQHKDLLRLGALTPSEMRTLGARLQKLLALGWQPSSNPMPPLAARPFPRQSGLELLAQFDSQDDATLVPVKIASSRLKAVNTFRVSFNDFSRAANELAEQGVAPSAAQFELIVMLTDELSHLSAARFARTLLKHVELDDRPGTTRELVGIGFYEPNSVTRFTDMLDEAHARLGRKLKSSEVYALHLEFFQHGRTLDAVLPEKATAFAIAHDPEASLADVALWAQLAPHERQRKRSALVADLLQRIGPGLERTDTNASDSEALLHHLDRLTLSDLQRMTVALDLLEDPVNRRLISAHLQQDVQRRDTELGGAFVYEDGQRRFRPLTPTTPIGDNFYEHPADQIDARGVLATAHFHAGGARFAGPSGEDEILADRGAAWAGATPDLVITPDGQGGFGVDYYTPSGATVDLGTFPSGARQPA